MRNSRLLDRAKAVEFVLVLLAACGLFVGAATLSARSAAHGAQDNTFTLKARSELVLLDVCVRYPKDGFVLGLKRDNFEVYEEGRKQPITQFGSVDSPVTIGLVVDASGSMRSKRAEVVEAGLAFAKESNPHDEFFVVNFNDRVVREACPPVCRLPTAWIACAGPSITETRTRQGGAVRRGCTSP